MKRALQKTAAIIIGIIIATVCLAPAKEVRADYLKAIPYRKNVTISKDFYAYHYVDMGGREENAEMTLKSSNRKVIFTDENGSFFIRKAGKTTLTIYIKKNGRTETYKMHVKVVNYKNPVAKIKLGTKNLTSEFKKGTTCSNYKPKKRRVKLHIKPKAGWKIQSIENSYYDSKTKGEVCKRIKNGKKVTFSKGDYSGRIDITLRKKKSNRIEVLTVYVNYDYM